MDITVEKNTLIDCLNIAGRTVSAHSTLSILECILITADKDSFTLMSNDLEMNVETSAMNAEVFETGSVALNAKILSEITRKMPGNFVRIKSDEKNMTECTSGRALFNIAGMPGDEFPANPPFEKNAGYTLKSALLKDMIRQTVFSTAVESTKPILTGELIKYENGELVFVAVDGFRIAYRKTRLPGGGEPVAAVIPAKALNELNRILPAEDDEEVKFYFSEKRIVFEMRSATFVSRLLEGDFIRYDQIYNEDFSTIVTTERLSLLAGLERACLIAGVSKKPPVKLEIKDESIIMTSATEIGRSYDEITCDIDGKELEIGFNPRYMIEALRVIGDEKVVLRFNSPLSPCIIKGLDSDEYKYLILPLKLRS